MTNAPAIAGTVNGRLDADGRLIEADPPLAALHEHAGGRPGGVLAVPQIATLARLARRLGITVARPAIAADGERDLDLWVRAEPRGNEVTLEISGWTARAAQATGQVEPEEREADFLRAGADWTWETDETLALTQLSPSATTALGRTARELIGRRMVHLFRFREAADGTIPILIALAEHSRFDGQLAELAAAPGSHYLLSGVPLIDGMGRFAGFRGSAVVVHRAESSADAEHDRASDGGAFGARLDQALRTPLNHIVNAAELLRAQHEGPLRREYTAYATDIASAGRHLLAMVDDLVDLQAIERDDFTPEIERIDLADVARRAAGLLSVRAAERRVRIDKPGDGEALPALGEFRRVLQIMMNLLVNAIRYSPEGSMVWIRTERVGQMVALTVADLGKGIAPEDQDRVFDKFERVDPSEPGGTGLGLYIARRLARAMGGDILLDSAPGQGARFTLTLPAA
ncbi:HAMP domain-containing sensor histidine kinase [Sphingosinicella sp. YJ22]|uniref:sensor histidine kinase n=1 Tax=Sphingosinicella sp. YJ22 TaxID=1104780 RepID=UPI00140E59EB|nr:HAMP domain-containing sensor histidine kinase [Sphingosinicella sp. YJ22]